MRSLWADYYKETHGLTALEYEWGFATLRIFEDYVQVEDFYIVPDERGGTKSHQLMDQICAHAAALKKVKVVCPVALDSRTKERSIAAQLKYGFSILGAKTEYIDRLWLAKEVLGG